MPSVTTRYKLIMVDMLGEPDCLDLQVRKMPCKRVNKDKTEAAF